MRCHRARKLVALAAAFLAAAVGVAGCAGPGAWRPAPLSSTERGEYGGRPPEVRGELGSAAGEVEMVERLARLFYVRITNRRFNTIATYHDPALREFFKTPEAFSDWFASFSDALDSSYFEALRPEHAWLEELDVEAPDRILVTVRLRGQNGRPLRFWTVDLVLVERWEQSDGRWWIIPGKL